MALVIWQIAGVVVFFVGVLALGVGLRRRPTAEGAHRMSVASHVLFHAGLTVPMVWGLFWPSAQRYDGIVQLPSLPAPTVCSILGIVLLVTGCCFAALSNFALMKRGQGLACFILSKRIVEASVYDRVRNPMALSWYLMCLGVALCAGSTYLILYLLLGHIPAHLFYLKFFEERELTIRFGEPYRQYRQRVPFLFPWGRPTQ